MKLHELRSPKGARKQRKRKGRGIAAGQGKTAGRGTKGQGSRSGGGKGPYFEGGQPSAGAASAVQARFHQHL